MKGLVSETVIEVLAVIGSAIGAAIFTIGGLLTEQDGLQNMLAGHLTLGAWEAAFGLIFLFFGVYLIGYQQFWERLTTLQSR